MKKILLLGMDYLLSYYEKQLNLWSLKINKIKIKVKVIITGQLFSLKDLIK